LLWNISHARHEFVSEQIQKTCQPWRTSCPAEKRCQLLRKRRASHNLPKRGYYCAFRFTTEEDLPFWLVKKMGGYTYVDCLCNVFV
jgi:hypothetical protein